MTVWVVTFYDFYDWEISGIHGVYGTERAAHVGMKEAKENNRHSTLNFDVESYPVIVEEE